MRNTQTKRRGTIASGGGNKSELDMLSKQFPVTLTSERKEGFSYNIGRRVNDNKKCVATGNKTPSDHKSGTQSTQRKYSDGIDKKAAAEMRKVPATAEDEKQATRSSFQGNSTTESSRRTKSVPTTKSVSNKTLNANKTRNSVFEGKTQSPRKSLTEHVRKEDSRVTKAGKEDKRIGHIGDVCDEDGYKGNIRNGLSEKQHFDQTNDSKLSGSDENKHLKPPASESERRMHSKHDPTNGMGSSPTDSRKSSLSRRSMVSMASSTTSANSLFDKILESRATMSSGSSESLQDLASRRYSFQNESVNSYLQEKRDSKSDSGSLVIGDSGPMEIMSPDRKHAPDVVHISGENEKPIIKRTRTRRIIET